MKGWYRLQIIFPDISTMDDDAVLLTIDFNGKLMELPTVLRQFGYSFRIDVTIGDTVVSYEPDEERNWRAMISYEDVQANKQLNPDLLKAIAAELENLTR